ARSKQLHSEYALPLLLEAVLIGIFGATGRVFEGRRVLDTVMLLCFTMGLQNAVVTKLSDAVIRTTHMTGIITDIGIELGRVLWGVRPGEPDTSKQDKDKLHMHSRILVLFFIGGVIGAFGFKYVGFLFTLPLVCILLMLAAIPVIDDLWHPTR
ncbi:MAG TPA: YoaK family protein, partial [Granulicella sp.]